MDKDRRIEELEAAMEGRTVSCVCGGQTRITFLESKLAEVEAHLKTRGEMTESNEVTIHALAAKLAAVEKDRDERPDITLGRFTEIEERLRINRELVAEKDAKLADLERARLIFQAMSDRVCHVVDCDCLPCDGLRLFKTPAPVAKEDKPLYGEPIGKCATGECGHDDSSWCDRRESK